MSTIFEISKQVDERAAQQLDRDPRDYREKMGELPARLRGGLLELPELVRSTQTFVDEKLRAYPLNRNLPPALLKSITQLRQIATHWRECGNNLEARIQNLLDRIDHAAPGHFTHFSPTTLADVDRGIASSLLSEVQQLRELPETLSRIEKEIQETAEFWKDRPFTPEPTAAVASRQLDDDGETIREFDARL